MRCIRSSVAAPVVALYCVASHSTVGTESTEASASASVNVAEAPAPKDSTVRLRPTERFSWCRVRELTTQTIDGLHAASNLISSVNTFLSLVAILVACAMLWRVWREAEARWSAMWSTPQAVAERCKVTASQAADTLRQQAHDAHTAVQHATDRAREWVPPPVHEHASRFLEQASLPPGVQENLETLRHQTRYACDAVSTRARQSYDRFLSSRDGNTNGASDQS